MSPTMQNVMILIALIAASALGIVMLGAIARSLERHLKRLVDK